MNPQIIYRKTAKGVKEVTNRTYGLEKHLRRVLIIVDGIKDGAELSAFIRAGEIDTTLLRLAAEGFIEPVGAGEVPSDHVSHAPAANEPAVFALIKHHAMAEISERLGPVGNLLVSEIDSCGDPLALRQKLRNIENVLVHVLGHDEGVALARKIGSELTRLT